MEKATTYEDIEMGRKSLKKKIEEMEAELQRLTIIAEENRLATKEQIIELIGEKYFCGIVIKKEGLLDILRMALETKDDVKVNFELYDIEKEEE
jgi:hypothetical protein